MCQSDSVFFHHRILYIGTAHQFQRRTFTERYEVRLESLLGIHIFLIAFSTQEADIELFQLFQTESPNGDVV